MALVVNSTTKRKTRALYLPREYAISKHPLPPPKGGIPKRPYPRWLRLILEAKLPAGSLPREDFTMTIGNLSHKLDKLFPDQEFDLSDPYLRYRPALEYRALNDPHCRRYFRRPDVHHHLHKDGYITPGDCVITRNLPEFNQYRKYLHRLYINAIRQYRARQYENLLYRRAVRECRRVEENWRCEDYATIQKRRSRCIDLCRLLRDLDEEERKHYLKHYAADIERKAEWKLDQLKNVIQSSRVTGIERHLTQLKDFKERISRRRQLILREWMQKLCDYKMTSKDLQRVQEIELYERSIGHIVKIGVYKDDAMFLKDNTREMDDPQVIKEARAQRKQLINVKRKNTYAEYVKYHSAELVRRLSVTRKSKPVAEPAVVASDQEDKSSHTSSPSESVQRASLPFHLRSKEEEKTLSDLLSGEKEERAPTDVFSRDKEEERAPSEVYSEEKEKERALSEVYSEGKEEEELMYEHISLLEKLEEEMTQEEISLVKKLEEDVTQEEVSLMEKQEEELSITERQEEITEEEVSLAEKEELTEEEVSVAGRPEEMTEEEVSLVEKQEEMTEEDISLAEKQEEMIDEEASLIEKQEEEMTEKEISLEESREDVTDEVGSIGEKPEEIIHKEIMAEEVSPVEEQAEEMTQEDVSLAETQEEVISEEEVSLTEKREEEVSLIAEQEEAMSEEDLTLAEMQELTKEEYSIEEEGHVCEYEETDQLPDETEKGAEKPSEVQEEMPVETPEIESAQYQDIKSDVFAVVESLETPDESLKEESADQEAEETPEREAADVLSEESVQTPYVASDEISALETTESLEGQPEIGGIEVADSSKAELVVQDMKPTESSEETVEAPDAKPTKTSESEVVDVPDVETVDTSKIETVEVSDLEPFETEDVDMEQVVTPVTDEVSDEELETLKSDENLDVASDEESFKTPVVEQHETSYVESFEMSTAETLEAPDEQTADVEPTETYEPLSEGTESYEEIMTQETSGMSTADTTQEENTEAEMEDKQDEA